MALLEILHQAILLAFPDEGDDRQALARAAALRLLDGRVPNKPDRFHEGMCTLGVYLRKSHTELTNRVLGQSKMSAFLRSATCKGSLIYYQVHGLPILL